MTFVYKKLGQKALNEFSGFLGDRSCIYGPSTETNFYCSLYRSTLVPQPGGGGGRRLTEGGGGFTGIPLRPPTKSCHAAIFKPSRQQKALCFWIYCPFLIDLEMKLWKWKWNITHVSRTKPQGKDLLVGKLQQTTAWGATCGPLSLLIEPTEKIILIVTNKICIFATYSWCHCLSCHVRSLFLFLNFLFS